MRKIWRLLMNRCPNCNRNLMVFGDDYPVLIKPWTLRKYCRGKDYLKLSCNGVNFVYHGYQAADRMTGIGLHVFP